MSKALDIPPTVEGDPNALEVARIWAAHGQQHVCSSFRPVGGCGQLGYYARRPSSSRRNAYEKDGRGDYFGVLGRIRQLFDAEWDSPTDIARGKLT